MTTTFEERCRALHERFSRFSSWEDKYRDIIRRGKAMDSLSESFKTPDYLVRGCQSQVWLVPSRSEDGSVVFRGDSDAVIVKGLVALVCELYSGLSSQEILASEYGFLEDLDLSQNLSTSRNNGLKEMLKMVKVYALAYSVKK